jgi:hypothetical protein
MRTYKRKSVISPFKDFFSLKRIVKTKYILNATVDFVLGRRRRTRSDVNLKSEVQRLQLKLRKQLRRKETKKN